jgi:hypothetical protein
VETLWNVRAHMEHDEAVETMAAERYILNDMAPEESDAFESHFSECPECAEDVRTLWALRKILKAIYR